MASSIYVNLPVKDLAAATRFYEAIGCTKNEAFSDDKTSSMVWSDAIHFHLMTREHFATFSPRQVADAHKTCQVLVALTRDRREDVDSITEAAATAGGKADVRERMDLGWLYNRAFEDVDGNVFEAVWVDSNAASMMGEQGSTS